MVQDPMIDTPMPVQTSLPRHFACETFIPASMDMISTDELDNVDALQMSAPRRSSTANLQAAFASSNSSSFGGAPTSPSFSRRYSQSTSNLARTSVRNTSFSNLTSQLQSPVSARSPASFSTSNPQIVVPSPQVASPTSNQVSPKLKHNKSFYSYADVITEEDQESKYQVRRPSLSLSLSFSHNGNGPSSSRLSRTSSMCSSNNNSNMMSRSINSHSSQQLYQQGSPINTSFSFGSMTSSSGNGNNNCTSTNNGNVTHNMSEDQFHHFINSKTPSPTQTQSIHNTTTIIQSPVSPSQTRNSHLMSLLNQVTLN
ncbi:unnamed protein product [Ambrosiozyma monospora]|uniref:Unnamed protein product n=1 Tax=Ambrosiozyma monospora TaxID=43982 RepID=A0ACB5U0I6_AMBMO|nr:unnamed protein product [Ambrosiozyma monospora]